jgi:allophanate hydrolase
MVHLAVVGAHLSGQPLNHQLTDRDATLVTTTTTAPVYRLFALRTTPPKPGLVRVAGGDPAGRAIEVEVWELAPEAFASFVDAVPAPLCIGRVRLAGGPSGRGSAGDGPTGGEVAGFLCEPVALADAVEITAHGGWRRYLARPDGPPD